MGVGWCLSNGFEKFVILLTYALCSYVFGDLVMHRLLVGLINLYDLFDLAAEIAG